ncbi:MAG: murein biosynthesis integral membrane protein MurJ [Spirochaetaceae bacterium]|nr:murein biosynthesis integral membrane protein MurJ [Spirochaetaceae bacterium]
MKKKEKKSLFASGVKLSFITLFSRILGVIREATKADFLGTTALADAFGIAFTIPNLFRRLFAENSVSVAFIPTFKEYLDNSNTEEGRKITQDFISASLTLVSFLTALVVIIGIIVAPFIVKFFTNAEGDIIQETALLTRIMFPYLFVISVAALFQGILNGLKIFTPSGFTPILFNLCVIGGTYLLSPYTANPARAMAIGVIVGGTIQALFQLPFVLKNNWKINFSSIKKAFTNPGTRKVMSLIGPTIIGMAAYQLNDAVSIALAGNAGTGVVSSLQYSLRLQELILGIFAVSIGTVILPDLTGFAKSQNWQEFNKMLTLAVRIIALITIPITFYSLVTGEHIISLVYKNNKFTDESVSLTMEAFKYHIIGLFFIAVNRIISPAFYAQSNTKSPTLAGIIGFVSNIIIALILVTPMAGGGIALALTIASGINTLFLFIFLAKNGTVSVLQIAKDMILYAIKMIAFSLIALIPVLFLKDELFNMFTGYNRFIAEGIPLVLSALLFALIGILLLVITKDPLVKLATKKIRPKKETSAEE